MKRLMWIAALVLMTGCGSQTVARTGVAPSPPDAVVLTASSPAPGTAMTHAGFGSAPTTFNLSAGAQSVSRSVASPFADTSATLMSFPVLSRTDGFVIVDSVSPGATDPSVGFAYFVSKDFTRRVELGRATRAFPSPNRNEVWLYSDDSTAVQRTSSSGRMLGRRSITRVDVAGTIRGGPYVIQDDREPVGIVDDGVVMTAAGNPSAYDVWDLEHSRLVRHLDVTGSISIDAGHFVVRSTPGPDLTVQDIRQGTTHAFQPDAGHHWVVFDIAADGSKIAMVELPDNSAAGPDAPATVVVCDLASDAETARYSYRSSGAGIYAGWSPSGDWLFATQDEDHIQAFRPEDPRKTVRVVAIPQASAFVVTNS